MQIKFGDFHGEFAHVAAIREALNHHYHEGLWRDLWLDVISWDLQYSFYGERGTGRQMIKFLGKHDLKISYAIFVDDICNDHAKKQWLCAVRSLLQDVTGYIDSYGGLDLTIYISEQLAKSAIIQNYGQFRAYWAEQ